MTIKGIPIYEVRLVKARRPLRIAEGTIANANNAASALHSLIGLTDREHLACLFVNAHHGVVGAHIASIGGQHAAAIDPRTILRTAILACASAIVLGHNHPSGDPSPSSEDLTFTAAIMRAAREVTIPVLDHVIVTREPGVYHSMLSQHTLPNV